VRGRAGALLLSLLAAAALAAPAQAAGSDAAATRAYVQADYRLMAGAVGRIPIAEAALRRVLAEVRSGCPSAAAGSPQNPMSTQLSDELIGALVLAVVDSGLDLAHSYIAAAAPLRWSSGGLTRQVQTYVGKVRVLSRLRPPSLCADVRAWAASGFSRLPATTEAFDARFMPAWVGAGELPAGLSRFEQGETRALARRAHALESRFEDFEARAVEKWGAAMETLQLWP
jgi:hypothetical protein